ncbi:MAG: PKD domain-containing protein [Saprospiraceae bacterium]
MKKILFVLSFLCTAFMINAQVISVSGIVTDSSTGMPASGVQIIISNPTFGGSIPVGWATTDANGSYFWLDSIGAFPISGAGILDVSMIDCNGLQVNQSFTYTPNQLSLTANFMYCAGGSGGGGSGSCVLSIPLPFVSGNTISANASLSGNGVMNYFWDMGDGATYATQTATHTYAQAGSYTICVVGLNTTTNCVDSLCMPVSIGSVSNCSAMLTVSPDTLNPMMQDFTVYASGGTAPYTYMWDFGDGITSTVQSPTHMYAQSGTYNACVTITDATGCTATDCMLITVTNNQPCTASFTYFLDTLIPNSGYNYVFISGNFNSMEVWDYGDGTTDSLFALGTTTHTYSTPGVYNVCLTTIDLTTGCVATYCDSLFVTGNTTCQAMMSHMPDSTNPMTNYFNVTATGGSAPYTYDWDFGDGNTSTVQSPTHTYAQSGTYYACVTVTDVNGCITTDCQLVNAFTNTPCTTSFTSSASAMNPNTYTFTSANAGNNNVIYFWDFGDGGSDSSGLGTTTYTYTQAGTYLACLFEIDIITGCIATYCDTVIIGGGAACQAFITYNNNIGSLVVDFFGSTTTNNNPVTYAWDFGDGNTSTVQSPTHTYQTVATGPVTFNVTLTTTDANGCTAVATETVLIFGGTGNGSIMGYMWKDTMNFTPADGLVYLIEYDSTMGTLTAIDTVMTQQGFFDFQNVPMGLYLVKGALLPTDPDYANYMPTYFIQSLNWSNGQYVSPTPFGLPALIDLQLVAGTNPGGAGFIGGLVVNGAGRPVNNGVTTVDNVLNMIPMEGISVLLLDANNNAVTHTVTNADGEYSFENIAMGTYNVHVEEVGKITYPANITVDGANMNHTDVHFTVHDNMVTLTGAYAVSNVEDFQVFPNPVRNTANIQLELTESMNLTMTVTNLMGQEFINQPLNLNAGDNSFQVEMSELPTGLYMVSLKSETDVITYKIQKL